MRRILLYLCLALLPLGVAAQSGVVVTAKTDSMMLMIGQQTGIHLEVTCDAGRDVTFPPYRDTIVTGLEIIPPVLTDTQYVNEGKRMTIRRDYTVTCFDSAVVYVPSMPVMVDTTIYDSNPLAMIFMSFDIPEGQEGFYGPKPIMMALPTARELGFIPLYWLLVFVGAAIGFMLLYSFRNDKPIIKRIKVEAKLPAHVKAINDIEVLKKEGSSHSEDAKAYYTQLTDILREYINDRFGFNATEMTSYEILERLEQSQDKESLSQLRDLLMTSDMVKFAKFKPMLNENDRNLMSAMEFVNDTKIDVPEEELKPREIETVVEMKRSKEARLALLLSGLTVSIAAVTILVMMIMKIYYLF